MLDEVVFSAKQQFEIIPISIGSRHACGGRGDRPTIYACTTVKLPYLVQSVSTSSVRAEDDRGSKAYKLCDIVWSTVPTIQQIDMCTFLLYAVYPMEVSPFVVPKRIIHMGGIDNNGLFNWEDASCMSVSASLINTRHGIFKDRL